MKKSISILKETLAGEKRVILLPKHVKGFIQSGYDVYVEENAGIEIGVTNKEYENVGATIVTTEQAWTCSNVIIKYKAPTEKEYKYFRHDLTISAIFHAEGNEILVKRMCETGLTAYSYEFFETEDGYFPLAMPGGEIAGKVAFFEAAHLLQTQFGGCGRLLADVHGVSKSKIIVIGYGNVGNAIINMAYRLGNEIVVFGTNLAKMKKSLSCYGNGVKLHVLNREKLLHEIKDADAVFGAILISTFDTPPIIDEDILKYMKRGSILMDVTCGYGCGYMPTFRKKTSLQKPYYVYNDILHCKIDNLPAAFPETTTIAYSNNAAEYLFEMAESIYGSKNDPVSAKGQIIKNGNIIHPVIRQHLEFYETVK